MLLSNEQPTFPLCDDCFCKTKDRDLCNECFENTRKILFTRECGNNDEAHFCVDCPRSTTPDLATNQHCTTPPRPTIPVNTPPQRTTSTERFLPPPGPNATDRARTWQQPYNHHAGRMPSVFPLGGEPYPGQTGFREELSGLALQQRLDLKYDEEGKPRTDDLRPCLLPQKKVSDALRRELINKIFLSPTYLTEYEKCKNNLEREEFISKFIESLE
jgi:hypothetical protein